MAGPSFFDVFRRMTPQRAALRQLHDAEMQSLDAQSHLEHYLGQVETLQKRVARLKGMLDLIPEADRRTPFNYKELPHQAAAAKQLRDSELQLLDALSHLEYYQCQVETLKQRINRLTETTRNYAAASTKTNVPDSDLSPVID
jgi:uncharacterized protein YPO0396